MSPHDPPPPPAPDAARAALEAVFADVAAEIKSRGPACWASGRCCNFAFAGHRLYVTRLEALYTLARLDPAARPTAQSIAEARARGGCPFQQGNLCGAHEIKPLGCRVYFCDRSAQAWQQDLTEHMLGRIRQIHNDHGIEYRYGEWLGMLESLSSHDIPAAPPAQGLDMCSRQNSDHSRPVDLTVGGKGGGRENTPDNPPFNAAQ